MAILWSGVVKDGLADVMSAWLPRQYASPGFFAIPGDELFALNKTIYELGEQIVAQVHTHPTLAFHSETDSEFAVTAMEGGLSIVIPDFGDAPLESLSKCAYFRFMSGRWNRLSHPEVKRLVRYY
ncbi:MAG: Mov34/MPN/PAD-1 family protein [Nitrososphaerota archaeon]|nr:Mov34/MPN/PAD-1 family protein [Nitrososphaerota archaeon]